jgi:hypothetical protein
MLNEITKYMVACEHDLEKMTAEVNEKIKDGWQPFGSFTVQVPVINEGPAPLYSQAMVKYKEGM